MASEHPGPREQGPLQNGQIFNNQYEIVDVIGSGGHAFVYRAKHRFLQHLVAIKAIHRAAGVSLEMMKRAQAEAQIEFRLKERGIVTVYDAGINDDGLLYIIMELLRGCSGREALDQHGKLNVREVLRMAKSVATTLQVAHNAGIVHRDLKPENLFFTVEDITKVLDFGVAKIDEVAGWQTRANSALGTFIYMSPEQALGHIVINRSDIYTLGLIIFEMLVGTHPVIHLLGGRPMSMHALSRIICHESLPDLHQLDPGIPSYVAKLVNQATEKNPEDRFSSMEEITKAIQACEDLLDAEDRRLGRQPLVRDLSRKVPGSSGVKTSKSGAEAVPEFESVPALHPSYIGVLPSVRAPQTPRGPGPDAARPVSSASVGASNPSERPTVFARGGAGHTAPLEPPQQLAPKAIPAAPPAPVTPPRAAPAVAAPVASVVVAPVAAASAAPVAAAPPTAARSVAPRTTRAQAHAEPEPQLPMEGPDFVRLLWGVAAGILLFGLAAAYLNWRSHASPRSPEPALVAAPAAPVVHSPAPLSEEAPATPTPVPTPEAGTAATPTPSPAETAPSPTPRASLVPTPPALPRAAATKPKATAKSGDVTQSDIAKMEQHLRSMGIEPDEKPRRAAPRPSPSPSETTKSPRNTVF